MNNKTINNNEFVWVVDPLDDPSEPTGRSCGIRSCRVNCVAKCEFDCFCIWC